MIFSEEKFNLLFMTIPSRIKTPRFAKTFFSEESNSLPKTHLEMALKRREPKIGKTETGAPLLGWTETCAPEEFESAANELSAHGWFVWLNMESEVCDQDLRMVSADPSKFGALVSGVDLTPDRAERMLAALPSGVRRMLAFENEEMLLGSSKLLDSSKVDAIIIGTSYLSESSKIYDQMGLEKFRSIMRMLAKKSLSKGIRPLTTSNFCSFDPTGGGDKNRGFVAEQIEFLNAYPGIGSLTRFYSHIDIVDQTRARLEDGDVDGV